MPTLFVANCTSQNQEIHYRLDFNDKGAADPNSRYQPAKKQTVAPGRQIALGGRDLHVSQVEDIIKQLSKYGLVGTVDVPHLKRRAPYVCSVDKPVTADVIRRVMSINKGAMIEEGKQRRAKAAIVVNDTVAKTVEAQFADAGVGKIPEQAVEVEFEQLEQSEAGEKTIEEGYRIDAKADSRQAGKGSRRRRS